MVKAEIRRKAGALVDERIDLASRWIALAASGRSPGRATALKARLDANREAIRACMAALGKVRLRPAAPSTGGRTTAKARVLA